MIEIALTRGRIAVVDDADADLAALRWHAARRQRNWYATRSVAADGRQTIEYLHRVVALRVGLVGEVDHRDGDGLNCRRDNLRVGTHQQNTWNARRSKRNTSGFKGVSARGDRWRAYIRPRGVQKCLGTFDTPELAARAYDAAARDLFGDFARLNFPVSS